MSERIEDTLSVLKRIRNGYRPGIGLSQVRELRIEAQDAVAGERQIASTTVSDKYRRQMEPDFTSTGDFDNAVWAWLTGGSGKLEQVLRKHAVTVQDRRRIDRFFSEAP